ncbi:MAG TPA: pyruvate ferredoxin oxidoreductase, partial [Phaeodactylibacter sp.]|nr:pyruvate ferredoxin oxidoreductase [Phaeodactylibacter sp.]
MDYKNISQLLEKYWEGETSLQEENTLKQYFNQENVAQELQEYQPLFQFFKEEQDLVMSDDFE